MKITRNRHAWLPGAAMIMAAAAGPAPAEAAELGLCRFDTVNLVFRGTPVEQARCLLRRVRPRGSGSDPQPISAWLEGKMGQAVAITPARFSQYLSSKGVDAAGVGGPVGSVDIAFRRYFVIHDTSSPEFSGISSFPPTIDSPTWSGNSLSGHADMVSKVNVVTNRVGASRTITDFNLARTRPATKLEMNSVAPQARKVFLHVENVQPRIKPAGSWGHIAPDPGFSPSQIHRLALVYVAASVRAGRWLIPALHFNVDSGATALEPHDDPQKFDLAAWAAAVESIAGEIGQP